MEKFARLGSVSFWLIVPYHPRLILFTGICA
jgi:hypothetical protein